MANNLIIEIGAFTLRANLQYNNKSSLVPLGKQSSPYFCPAETVEIDGSFIFGEDAIHLAFSNPERYYHICDMDPLSEKYKKVLLNLLQFIISRCSRIHGDSIDSITFVIPAYFAIGDPRKSIFRDAASKVGINNAHFAIDAACVCSRKISVDDGEGLIYLDFGYSGTTLSYIKREGSAFIVNSSKQVESFSGRMIDGLILSDLLHTPMMYDNDNLEATLLISHEENCAASAIKERLSSEETINAGVFAASYEVSRHDFEVLISPYLTEVLQATKDIVNSSGIGLDSLHTIAIAGGCANIPIIASTILQYFQSYNSNVKIVNCARDPEYIFEACKGAIIKQSISSLSF